MMLTALDNPKCIDFSNTLFHGNSYVYVWVDECLCPFYVGSGIGNRGFYDNGHKNRLGVQEKVNHKCSVYLIAKNMNRHRAYFIEMYTIRYYVWSKIELKQTQNTHGVYNENNGAIYDAFHEAWDYVLFKHYEYIAKTQGYEATSINIKPMLINARKHLIETERFQNKMRRYNELRDNVDRGIISVRDACNELNISYSTWYNRKKQFWWQAETAQ